MTKERIKAYILHFFIYIAELICCVLIYKILPFKSPLLKIFICEMSATLITYLTILIFKNPQFMDPFLGLCISLMGVGFYLGANNPSDYALVVVVAIVIYGFYFFIKSMSKIKSLRTMFDKYVYLQNKYKKLYSLILPFRICFLPSLVVFLGLLPAFYYIYNISTSSTFAPTMMTIVSMIIIFLAITILVSSDATLYAFKRVPANDGLVYTKGLWKNSRHPNYFGEILFYFGLFLVQFSMTKANPIFVFSPLIVFLYFVAFVIPFADAKELSTKAAYKEYMKHTNPLLILFAPSEKK